MCAIEVTPCIGTERLLLRGPVRSDANDIARLGSDLNVAGQTVTLPHPFDEDAAEDAVVRAMRVDWDREAAFAIEHRNFGVVGMLSLQTQDPTRGPELDCWIGRPFWNRGYATEAVRAALKWAKRDWRKKLVVAGHFADNAAGGQVLCKAGFLYTGDIEPRVSPARGHAVPTRLMVWLA